MKSLPIALAAIVLATTVYVAAPTTAQAGCAITVVFKNKTNKTVTISKNDSKVATKLGPAFSIWRKFLDADVTIGKNKEKSVATSLHSACAAGMRKFKFKWSNNGSESGWVNKRNVFIPTDRKVKVKIK